MFLYNMARKVNTQIKKYRKMQNGKYLSPCRRIEFVSPPAEGKFVAMTFDDGPTTYKTTSNKDKGLTETLCEIMAKYDAKGTFDVIGTTQNNYPDEEGKMGDFTWSGVYYDHYPMYNADVEAGAINQPDLIRKILEGGHEISSHTYTHRLFGPMRAVYGKRKYLTTLDEVVEDLSKLHKYIKEEFDYDMKLSRPPHYIDKIPDGSTTYDAYRIMGYNYVAASFDGGGWQPLETYQQEVNAMIEPLKTALEKDENSLNGKIIFQKDGCNMNLRTPVADALEEQLKLLKEYGYKVVTVSDLLKISPFEDLKNTCDEIKYVRELLEKNHTIAYKNNTFAPDRIITAEEFMIMCANPELFMQNRTMTYKDLVEIAGKNALNKNINLKVASGNEMLNIASKLGINVEESKLKDKEKVKRIEAIELIAKISEKVGENGECYCNRCEV